MSSFSTLVTPPGKPSIPYILPCYNGELWTIPASNSVMRLLVTGNETEKAFAIVSTGGQADRPIGFHYHREAHDIFLCLKGTVNVWADEKARSLSPGDLASVPPNTVHQFQLASAHTEFIGLIIPGGWEEFFRFIGDPFSGPLFPTNDKRNPMEVLVPKLIAAAEKFDMVPLPRTPHFDPQPWDGTENTLPGKCEKGGYFLKANTGPAFEVGGAVVRPLVRTQESDGHFSIYSIENSSHFAKQGFQSTLQFAATHHALQVVDGVVKVVVNGEEVKATGGETVFIPADARFSIKPQSVYSKLYLFANGGGLGELLECLGKKYEFAAPPLEMDVTSWDTSKLESLESRLGFSVAK